MDHPPQQHEAEQPQPGSQRQAPEQREAPDMSMPTSSNETAPAAAQAAPSAAAAGDMGAGRALQADSRAAGGASSSTAAPETEHRVQVRCTTASHVLHPPPTHTLTHVSPPPHHRVHDYSNDNGSVQLLGIYGPVVGWSAHG